MIVLYTKVNSRSLISGKASKWHIYRNVLYRCMDGNSKHELMFVGHTLHTRIFFRYMAMKSSRRFATSIGVGGRVTSFLHGRHGPMSLKWKIRSKISKYTWGISKLRGSKLAPKIGNIENLFLNVNRNVKSQPCDAGITTTLKTHYRRFQLDRTLSLRRLILGVCKMVEFL